MFGAKRLDATDFNVQKITLLKWNANIKVLYQSPLSKILTRMWIEYITSCRVQTVGLTIVLKNTEAAIIIYIISLRSKQVFIYFLKHPTGLAPINVVSME